ncbi:MAG: primosomal protein N' [Actinobacteria bacterium]|nr:primosomal protein N' [Actinomycetota bacterium]
MQGLFSKDEPNLLVASVAFDSPLDKLFDYQVPSELSAPLQVGQRVQAPFGRANRLQIGFCVAITDLSSAHPLKTIRKVVDSRPLISAELLVLARWISSYYCCPLGKVLAGMVPASVKRSLSVKPPQLYRLTDSGRACLTNQLSVRLGPKQRAVLQTLAEDDQSGSPGLTRRSIIDRTDCSGPTLRSLVHKGYMELFAAGDCFTDEQPSEDATLSPPDWSPNSQQQKALDELNGVLVEPCFGVHLLQGVTGSGKTEVYIRAIEQIIKLGRQAIVLVPEIALTTQTLQRFRSRLPGVCVLHSGLSSTQRRQQWLQIACGYGKVVVGPRSAVFAPAKDLGLIIVDEEHEPSYKQDTQPRYHGRDVAIKRAQLLNIPVILGSATPSLESLYNSQRLPHFSLIRLSRRVHDLPMPKIEVIDLRQERRLRKGLHIFSRALESQLRRILDHGQQAILLLNRRGYAGFVSCPTCDYVLTCENCDVTLTYHRHSRSVSSGRALCHYCLSESRVPANCPTCGQKLILLGIGTQRAEQELARKFPQARFARVDSDSMDRRKYKDVLERFGRGDLDILLGTQMIAKGLDFPRVHLVGILLADTSLTVPDFRSSERTFQLAAQVAGRAGRASPGARVVLQTFNPDFPAICFATTHDYNGFARSELALRESLGYPPFGRLARVILRSPSLSAVGREANHAAAIIAQAIGRSQSPVSSHGPLPPPIGRISGQHRLQFILRAPQAKALHEVLSKARTELFKLPVHVAIDMDPVNLL